MTNNVKFKKHKEAEPEISALCAIAGNPEQAELAIRYIIESLTKGESLSQAQEEYLIKSLNNILKDKVNPFGLNESTKVGADGFKYSESDKKKLAKALVKYHINKGFTVENSIIKSSRKIQEFGFKASVETIKKNYYAK